MAQLTGTPTPLGIKTFAGADRPSLHENPGGLTEILRGVDALLAARAVKIADSLLGAAASEIDFTGIPGTYSHLLVVLFLRSDAAVTVTSAGLRFNNDADPSHYFRQLLRGNDAAASAADVLGVEGSLNVALLPGANAGGSAFAGSWIFIPNYTTAVYKVLAALSNADLGIGAGGLYADVGSGSWRATAAINRITVLPAAGNFVASSRASVYALP